MGSASDTAERAVQLAREAVELVDAGHGEVRLRPVPFLFLNDVCNLIGFP